MAQRILIHLLKSCLHLLRGHQEQDTVFKMLVEAGDAAWARGAHEVRHQMLGLHHANIELLE